MMNNSFSPLLLDRLDCSYDRYYNLYRHVTTYGVDHTTYALYYQDFTTQLHLRVPASNFNCSPVDGAFTRSVICGLEGLLGDMWEGLTNFISKLFEMVGDFFRGLFGGGSGGSGGGGGSVRKQAEAAKQAVTTARDKIANNPNGSFKPNTLEHLLILPVDKIKEEYRALHSIIDTIGQTVAVTDRHFIDVGSKMLTKDKIRDTVKKIKDGGDAWSNRHRQVERDMIPFKRIGHDARQVIQFLDAVTDVEEREHEQIFAAWDKVHMGYESLQRSYNVYMKKTKKAQTDRQEYEHFSCLGRIINTTLSALNAIRRHFLFLLRTLTKAANEVGRSYLDTPIGNESFDMSTHYKWLTGAV